MSSTPYKDRLLRHLATYRRDVLGIPEAGTFRYRGRAVAVEHILPKDLPWLGIPSEVREQVRRYAETHSIKRHRYFHHLNSSQAFALSLFVPFFEGGPRASNALLRAVGVAEEFCEWKAEHVPLPDEGTNLDAWWRTASGAQFFREVKLTESEFGAATLNDARLDKLERLYEPRLRAHVPAARLQAEAFFAAYQIFRNLWYAAEASDRYVVFLFPRQHTALTETLATVLREIRGSLRDRIIVAYSEDVLARLRADAACPAPLREYAGQLANKYLLGTP